MRASALPQDQYFELASEVFIEFARFEYCLKMSGFLRSLDGNAEPDWDTFSNCDEIKKLFKEIKNGSATACNKMHYILTEPPKKQIVKGGILEWEQAPEISNSQEYFAAVRRVRNNLFHGGKFNGVFFEPERSANLLEAVMCSLRTARKRHPGIMKAYNQG